MTQQGWSQHDSAGMVTSSGRTSHPWSFPKPRAGGAAGRVSEVGGLWSRAESIGREHGGVRSVTKPAARSPEFWSKCQHGEWVRLRCVHLQALSGHRVEMEGAGNSVCGGYQP